MLHHLFVKMFFDCRIISPGRCFEKLSMKNGVCAEIFPENPAILILPVKGGRKFQPKRTSSKCDMSLLFDNCQIRVADLYRDLQPKRL